MTDRIYVQTPDDSIHLGWIDCEDYDNWDELLQDQPGYTESWDDLEWIASDSEGLADHFVGTCDSFDWDEYTDCRDFETHSDEAEEAKGVYIDWMGSWDRDHFEESYAGSGYESEQDYAEQFIDEVGYLDEMPEHLRAYFDYEAFARDLFIDDYHFDQGHIFRNV